jgi:flavodoxin
MEICVIYDSVFGNTGQIARAIAAALPGSRIIPVGEASPAQLDGLDLLVLGSPTRGFCPTEAVAALLTKLDRQQLAGVYVAAFDTRIELATIDSPVFRFIVDKGGYAANTIAKTLQKKGGTLLAPGEGFLVTGEQGPLKANELERAGAWAAALLSKVPVAAS